MFSFMQKLLRLRKKQEDEGLEESEMEDLIKYESLVESLRYDDKFTEN